jgi:hypothetical protein
MRHVLLLLIGGVFACSASESTDPKVATAAGALRGDDPASESASDGAAAPSVEQSPVPCVGEGCADKPLPPAAPPETVPCWGYVIGDGAACYEITALRSQAAVECASADLALAETAPVSLSGNCNAGSALQASFICCGRR